MLDHQEWCNVLAKHPTVYESGATLIEAAITIAILALLVALGFPSLQTWLFNSRIRTGAEEVLAGLQLARSEAVRQNCSVELLLNTVAPTIGAGWTVQATAGCPGGAAVIQTQASTEGVTGVLLTPTPVAATQVTFDGLGRLLQTATPPLKAINSNNTDAITRIDIDLDPTILAPGDTRDLRINIRLNGQNRLCDPNVSVSTDSRFCL
jgi:type IV fimbrial biogenesis protein FimT